MAEATVGDELFGEDPTVRKLEAQAAKLLDKAAALFLPTCTLGNAVALLAHGCQPERVLLDVQSHIHRREMQPHSTLSRLRPVFYDVADGCPTLEQVRRFCAQSKEFGIVSLETTHTWRNGLTPPLDRLRAVSHEARSGGAKVHLDGARLFYAATALKVEPAVLAETADSVMFSLCKGIGAPVGAMLAGSERFIAAARPILYELGGVLRMPGMLAAAGLLALETGRQNLEHDIEIARRFAQRLSEVGVCVTDVTTNVVLFDSSPLGLSGKQFADLASQSGVQLLLLEANLVRITTHSGLSDADVSQAIKALTTIIEQHSRGAAV